MKFYEFNKFEYYSLIGADTMKDALEMYECNIADIDEKELKPDILSEEEARNLYCANTDDIQEEQKLIVEFNQYVKEGGTCIFLIDGDLI